MFMILIHNNPAKGHHHVSSSSDLHYSLTDGKAGSYYKDHDDGKVQA